MALRLPGHPIQDFPEDDLQKLNILFQELTKHQSTWMELSQICEYLGWDLDDFQKVKLKYLLDTSEHLDTVSFGNLGHNGYKLKPITYIKITEHGSFSKWQDSLKNQTSKNDDKKPSPMVHIDNSIKIYGKNKIEDSFNQNQDTVFDSRAIKKAINSSPATKESKHNAIVIILKKYWWGFLIPLAIAIIAIAVEHKWFK